MTARRAEKNAESFAPRFPRGEIAREGGPAGEEDTQRTIAAIFAGEAVGRRLGRHFVRVGSEQPIEDDRDAAEVSVEVRGVRRVVHAVMRGRVEDPFERPEFWDEFGMQEKLKREVDAQCREDGLGRKTEPDERKKKSRLAGDEAGDAEPHGRRRVEIPPRVMDGVRGPKQAHAVTRAMHPVVCELRRDERRDELYWGGERDRRDAVLPEPRDDGERGR